MKIAQVADAHYGLGYPGPSPSSRFEDITRVMNWVADCIIEENCDLVLVAGDFFKDANVFLSRASVEIAACVAWLRKLSEAGIQVIAISGTPSHDAIAAYELLKEMRIPGVTICTTPDVITFETAEDAVSIACLPGLNRSTIASKEEYSKLAPHEIHQLMTQKITNLVMSLAAECDYSPSILLSHITCVGADKGFEDLLQQQEPVLTKEAIEGSNFDLVCLGHIHRPQKIEGLSVPTFYCGSPERLSFNEEGIIPGFWIHKFEESSPALSSALSGSEFIETPARRFWTYDLDSALEVKDLLKNGVGDTVKDWFEPDVEGATYFPEAKNAILRVRYKATEEQVKQINPQAISRALYDAGAFYVAEIRAEVEKSTRTRAQEASAEMGPVEGLKMWCEVAEVPEKDRGELLDRTEGLLMEVGL